MLCLVSDWIGQSTDYYSLLEKLGIDNFFKPFSEKVTLSNEINVTKPDEGIFRAAIDKIENNLPFRNVFFIAEDKVHVAVNGEADTFAGMVPLINLFLLI